MTQETNLWVDGRLPRFVIREINRHGKTVYYFRREHGRRMRLPDISNERFLEIYKSILMEGKDYDYHAENPRLNSERRLEAEALIVLRRTMKSIRSRCTWKNLPFDLTTEFLADLAKEQNYRCALTGMKFKLQKNGPFRVDPYALTVDRIEPQKGYVQGNVRLICFAMNLALMNWGEDVFASFAIAFTQQHFKKRQASGCANLERIRNKNSPHPQHGAGRDKKI